MLTIIDYGIGNLRSIEKAFQAVGVDVLRTDRVADIERAERLVLPGVGAFGACAAEIRRRGLEQPILDAVARGKPFLGVCIGMQLLFEESEEMGRHRGLGILPGRVVKFTGHPVPAGVPTYKGAPEPSEEATDGEKPLKIPHMGWNRIVPEQSSPLLEGIEPGAYFYFVHSYHALPEDTADVIAHSEYGMPFPAIVGRNNVFGVQFHPEKSQKNGLDILRNFSTILI
ncbi:MAG TPA: imidazole glycerol phosphate synthase subunit HisH [Rhodothermales bacterium]|nr:imidazole glycerol phosphate synthase subunit HisH [Rhodothermales bacterium]